MNYTEYLSSLRGKRVAVLGVGVSNRPLVGILARAGADVTVCDKKSAGQLGDYTDTLRALGVRTVLGPDYLDTLPSLRPDVIFRTPGLRPDLPGIVRALENGAVLTSEMEAFFDVCPCPIIAVTGSEGKTTTTTEIAGLLRRAGKTVHIGGNIGTPLFDRTPEIRPEDIVAVELSSFQLMTMKKSAHTAVVKNVTPNHLDYHRGMEEYIRAKENIFLHAKPGSVAVLNGVNPVTKELGKDVPTGTEVRYFLDGIADVKDGYITYDGKPVLAASDILIPGRHNIENYTGVICALHGLVSDETVRKIAKTFGGVEHRIELVRTLDGVKYYNSSIDSSPTRTTAALNSFPGKVIVICGGYDKHIPFEPLAKPLCEKAKAVVLTGATAGKIKAALTSYPGYTPGSPEIAEEPDFEKAVLAAKSLAKPGDTVILSPACASFDAFPNFEVRGNRFKSIVNGF